jgi:hypothetical protein
LYEKGVARDEKEKKIQGLVKKVRLIQIEQKKSVVVVQSFDLGE